MLGNVGIEPAQGVHLHIQRVEAGRQARLVTAYPQVHTILVFAIAHEVGREHTLLGFEEAIACQHTGGQRRHVHGPALCWHIAATSEEVFNSVRVVIHGLG